MTYILQHIAFYAFLSAPIWGPLYLFFTFTGFIERLKPKSPPPVYTPEEMTARHARTTAMIAKFVKPTA